MDNFKNKGLETLIDQVEYPTGTVQVQVDANGVPCYDIKENVAWDNLPFTDRLRQLAESTCAVCFGLLAQRNVVSRTTINAFLDIMPDGDCQYKIFDVNRLMADDFHRALITIAWIIIKTLWLVRHSKLWLVIRL